MGSHVSPPRASADVGKALDAFRRIVRALRVSTRAVEKKVGVTGAQLFVLQKLSDGPAASVAELAARTVTDQSSVSVVVSRLCERGLVKRSPSRVDRRRSEIGLTEKGRGVLSRAPLPAQARLVQGLAELPRGELKSLARGLDRLVLAMGAGDERPLMFFEGERKSRKR